MCGSNGFGADILGRAEGSRPLDSWLLGRAGHLGKGVYSKEGERVGE